VRLKLLRDGVEWEGNVKEGGRVERIGIAMIGKPGGNVGGS
jgi:hypothetical protein